MNTSIITDKFLKSNYSERTYLSHIDEKDRITNLEIIKHEKQKSKQGWHRMYKSLLNVYSECNSKLENQVVQYILENTNKQFLFTKTNKQIVSHFKISEAKVKILMIKLRKLQLIDGRSGMHILNPFMWVPYQVSDEVINDAQIEWKANKGEE